MPMSEFLTLVFAIYLADCCFEVTRLVVVAVGKRRSRTTRDARGRFVARVVGR